MGVQSKSAQMSSSVYNELRLQGRFCDAVIIVEDVEFKIHKVILYNCSSYFGALFSRWSPEDRKVFNISGLSPRMMELIIEFAYTGSVSVTMDNVQELMRAADMLSVTDVVQTCSDFLSEQLSPENCVSIWQFLHNYLNPELQSRVYSYITDHFEEVVSHEEFLQLSAQELTDILGRDDLNVRKERTVYEAVLRWIAHIPEQREEYITMLLSKVRLALTSVEYIIRNVMSNNLVNTNYECRQIVSNAIQTVRHIVANRFLGPGVSNTLARPRLPNAILFAIGGWSGSSPTNGMEVYDVSADRWINVTKNLERPRAYAGSAFLNGYIYCVGGFDRLEYFNSVRRFGVSTHTWHEVAPMYHRRCYVSVTVLNGCIYALGGFDGHDRLSSAECYRSETNQWSFIAPMQHRRSDASCTTLHDKVYICGGFNGNECLQTAECYNPATNQWTMIRPMISRRSGTGVIAYAGHLYAVGGFDGISRLHIAEAYNPWTNTWRPVCPMLTSRSNFGLEVIDGHLFVVGGYNGFSTTVKVEYYDASTDIWCEACDMAISRSALSCCVVSRLPSMTEYTVPRDILPFYTVRRRHLTHRHSLPLT